MRLYISGPMTGKPDFNFPEFDALAAYLKDCGYEYISPAEHDRQVCTDLGTPPPEKLDGYAEGDLQRYHTDMGTTFENLLGWDLAQIASPECDGVVMLPGWENSTGAQHERYVAEACGKAVFLAKKTQMHGLWTLEGDPDRSLSAKRKLSDDFHPTRRLEGSLQPTPTPVIGARPEMGYLPPARGPEAYHDLGHAFTTKDSGVRKAFDSGMVRDTDEGKPRYDLIPLLPLRRLAELYARGAEKYDERNWEQASSDEELQRFKASAFRHLVQALDGDRDEDHWSGVVFNVFAAEWLENKLQSAAHKYPGVTLALHQRGMSDDEIAEHMLTHKPKGA